MSIFGDIFDPFGLFRNDDTHARSIQAGMAQQLNSNANLYQQACWQAQQNSVHLNINPDYVRDKKDADAIDAEFEVVEVKLLENK